MAWSLEIHTIDVAQGESSLIVARKDFGSEVRSMLIDGGLAKYGRQVNDFVSRHLHNEELDVMVTTHYDTDHSGGHMTLFQADNLTIISNVIGRAVGQAVQNQYDEDDVEIDCLIAGVASFAATVCGAYRSMPADTSGFVTGAIDAAFDAVNELNDATDEQILNTAFDAAVEEIDDIGYNNRLNPELMKMYNSGAARQISKLVARATYAARNGANYRIRAATDSFFTRIAPPPTQAGLVQNSGRNYSFQTGERYKNTLVYNPGKVDTVGSGISSKDLNPYFNALLGKVNIASYTASAPALRRDFEIPSLGQELLGTSDPDAPKVYCVAVLQRVLNSRTQVSTDNGNGISIGLAVVFGDFVFYTGGDLPVDGLNMIPNAIIGNATFGSPAYIPAFKAGHHGSSESNSTAYLTATKPKTSIISAGYRQFGKNPDAVLPRQDVINWFTAQATMKYFYLTNCKIIRTGVPYSNNLPQITKGNKSRIAGDNGFDPGEGKRGAPNLKAKQIRGNISMYVEEDQINTIGGTFDVVYWENQLKPRPKGSQSRVRQAPYGTRTESFSL